MDPHEHLNPAIARLAAGEPMFATIAPANPASATAMGSALHDAVIFEMEHAPWDGGALRDSLQYLLDRRAIHEAATLAPPVAPLVRIPANGAELNQWLAKQALDSGVYGVVWPHVSTVEEARSAVAACRYPQPQGTPGAEPRGLRGFGPSYAARYWGLDPFEYCARADTWPLAPDGDLLVITMCEDLVGVRNLPAILDAVDGIGAVLIGVADLSMDIGHLGRPHPEVDALVDEVLAACLDAGVACGIPGVTPEDVEQRLDAGFRLILAQPGLTAPVVDAGRTWARQRG